MRSTYLPILLKDTFAEHPEMRASIVRHFQISDWKMSQWMAGTKKPDPLMRLKVIDHIALLIRRKRSSDLA
jgi:succinate dehydrogenase flavin-adding protein (antitoxin of CptAB toxin-antitoxin module)